ncbi:hypothetical protein [Mycolicibacterium sarraceniae]|uniref:Uncharacterized protein n=1 Tax=Mycolicibacterium sarraceniae TaxID=1534348 RepID=A0A7I7SUY7_9MYCO|nr:hypothetical protein [Mycolicibacterium sarraceniae]BBY60121.1 hypothetical protein MSAR_32570 [Mycolicibacterium sarraceniae]
MTSKTALRGVVERMLQQFSGFEHRIMAVRGENVALTWSRWSDVSGNQAACYHTYELDDDGHLARNDRSADDLRASLEQLYGMVAAVRSWFPALRWLSPTLLVARLDREGTGPDGERYSWVRILVISYRDGLLASIGEFDADDDAAAFAYASEMP